MPLGLSDADTASDNLGLSLRAFNQGVQSGVPLIVTMLLLQQSQFQLWFSFAGIASRFNFRFRSSHDRRFYIKRRSGFSSLAGLHLGLGA